MQNVAMKQVICTIKGISPLQQSRAHGTPEKPNELKDEYELRTWMERAHVDEKGNVFHPGNALKQALVCAGAKKQETVSGKGQCKTKGFIESGIMIRQNLKINKTKDDIQKVGVFGSSTGSKSGKGGSRVMKYFPTLTDWEAVCEIIILDATITESMLKDHLEYAGIVAGIGTWRPQNGGDNGRFLVTKWEYQDFEG